MEANSLLALVSKIKRYARGLVVNFPSLPVIAPRHSGSELGFQMSNQEGHAAPRKSASAFELVRPVPLQRMPYSSPEPLSKPIAWHHRTSVSLIRINVDSILSGPLLPVLVRPTGALKPPKSMILRILCSPFFLLFKYLGAVLSVPFSVQPVGEDWVGLSPKPLRGTALFSMGRFVLLENRLNPFRVPKPESLLWRHNARPADKPAMENRKPQASRPDRANKIKLPFGYQAEHFQYMVSQ